MIGNTNERFLNGAVLNHLNTMLIFIRRMRLDRKTPLLVPGEKPGLNNKKENSHCQNFDALITRVSVNFHDLSIFAKYPINCQ